MFGSSGHRFFASADLRGRTNLPVKGRAQLAIGVRPTLAACVGVVDHRGQADLSLGSGAAS